MGEERLRASDKVVWEAGERCCSNVDEWPCLTPDTEGIEFIVLHPISLHLA